jgi:hypothetical protein
VREMATASSAAVPLVVSSRLRLLPSHYSARSRPHCLAVNGRRLDSDPGRRFPPLTAVTKEKCPWVG